MDGAGHWCAPRAEGRVHPFGAPRTAVGSPGCTDPGVRGLMDAAANARDDPTAVRIAAISDLHIGVRAGLDGFGHAIDAFDAWLARLEHDHDRIVLLGDVFQTDHVLVPG